MGHAARQQRCDFCLPTDAAPCALPNSFQVHAHLLVLRTSSFNCVLIMHRCFWSHYVFSSSSSLSLTMINRAEGPSRDGHHAATCCCDRAKKQECAHHDFAEFCHTCIAGLHVCMCIVWCAWQWKQPQATHISTQSEFTLFIPQKGRVGWRQRIGFGHRRVVGNCLLLPERLLRSKTGSHDVPCLQ